MYFLRMRKFSYFVLHDIRRYCNRNPILTIFLTHSPLWWKNMRLERVYIKMYIHSWKHPDYTWLGRRKMEGASTPQRHILIELSVTEAMSSEAVDIYRRVGFKGSPKFPPPFASSWCWLKTSVRQRLYDFW